MSKKNNISLNSTAEKAGKIVDQILISTRGFKKTLRNIETDTIEEGSRVKMRNTKGVWFFVRDKDTWIVEVHPRTQNND